MAEAGNLICTSILLHCTSPCFDSYVGGEESLTGRERERVERRDWETDGDEAEATRLKGCMMLTLGVGNETCGAFSQQVGERRGFDELKPSKE